VENTGVHYAETIERWYYNFQQNRARAVANYGEWQARLWDVFLAWSTEIARQGSSTVFMITAIKNLENDKASKKGSSQNRSDKWIGPRRIAAQQ